MARDFDGSADCLEATSVPVAGLGTDGVTLAAWVNRDASNTNSEPAISLGKTGANNRVVLFTGGTAGLAARAQSVNTANTSRTASTSVGYSAGAWTHCAAVFASTTSRSAYVNGGNKNSETSTSDPGSNWDRTSIGRRTDGTVYIDGKIALPAIWNVALSDDEIAALGAGYHPLLIRPQNLVFFAPLWRTSASDNEVDIVGGLTLAQTSSPVPFEDPPRIIYPRRRSVIPFAAATTGFRPAWARQNSRVIGGGV